jgi:hypothetical protein
MKQKKCFTKIEVIRRIKEAKSYLGNKDRIFIGRAIDVVPVLGYDPLSDDSYWNSKTMDIDYLKMLLAATLPRVKALDFSCSVSAPKSYLAFEERHLEFGLTVPIMFYPFSQKKDTKKYSLLWLGTWHHAPIVVWKEDKWVRFNGEKLPHYIDLL